MALHWSIDNVAGGSGDVLDLTAGSGIDFTRISAYDVQISFDGQYSGSYGFRDDVWHTSQPSNDNRFYFNAGGTTYIKGYGSTGSDIVFRDNADNSVFFFGGNATGPKIVFGPDGDTNLYRSAADTLKTDDQFKSASTVVSGDGAAGQITLSVNGTQYFGSDQDTNLYRSAANVLKTDDVFHVGITADTTGIAVGSAVSGAGVQIANYDDRRAVLNDYGIAFYNNGTDANPKIYFASDAGPGGEPGLKFGAGGGSTADVVLYRSAADVMTTPDSIVAGGLISTGAFIRAGTNSDSTLLQQYTITMPKKASAPDLPGADFLSLGVVAGTNANTLKLVARAGTGGAQTTILDNIPTT